MKILQVLFISCRRASELVHQKHNVGLNRKDRWRLNVHTKMCAACKSFESQTDQIEEAIKTRISQSSAPDLSDFKSETITQLK
jgi:hypothetical protein